MMINLVRRLLAVSMLLVLVCPQSLPATPRESIDIGVFLSMTGNGAAYGQMEWNGIKTAHAMVSQVLGREIKLFLVDTKSDKTEAINAADHLIKERKVVGLIGGSSSVDAIAGGGLAEKHAVPLVSPSATSPLVTHNKKYVFRVSFDNYFQGLVAARQAIIGMNARTAAVIVDIAHENYSVELANLFLIAFGEMGGKVLLTSYIETGDQDFRSQLAEILSKNPEIIYIPNYFTENALLAKEARDLGIKVPILMSDRAQVPGLIQTGGEAVEGVYLTGHVNLEGVAGQLGQDYLDNYKQEYNREIDAFGALAADAYFVLVDAIKRAGSTEGPKVRAALVNTNNFQGISGPITIGEDGNTAKGVVINRVQDGRFTYVTTVKP
jgi:branched-chain amino acid transport system substrate-binding protein